MVAMMEIILGAKPLCCYLDAELSEATRVTVSATEAKINESKIEAMVVAVMTDSPAP